MNQQQNPIIQFQCKQPQAKKSKTAIFVGASKRIARVHSLLKHSNLLDHTLMFSKLQNKLRIKVHITWARLTVRLEQNIETGCPMNLWKASYIKQEKPNFRPINSFSCTMQFPKHNLQKNKNRYAERSWKIYEKETSKRATI